jgi:hypothetical protein
MDSTQIQSLCERGQNELSWMQYLQAEKTLAEAEALAWNARDWDSLSRLYMPLQESRRQRRQRCGEGKIQLDFIARNAADALDGAAIAGQIQHGQILIAGWRSIQPAIDARRAVAELGLYLDIFLAAVYPMGEGRIIVIVPTANIAMPATAPMQPDILIRQLPVHSIVLSDSNLLARTYAATMALWERLHSPFLAAAGFAPDAVQKIDAYRETIGVDYACELAHQNISNLARKIAVGEDA